MEWFKFSLVGLAAGVVSGLFGVGGGLVIVPSLIFLLGYGIHNAVGTSLMALVLPVGILGVLEYHKAGRVDISAGLLIGAGLFLGTYIGAKLTHPIPPLVLRKVYGGFLLLVSLRLLIGK